MDQEPQDQNQKAGIDLSKILLPKKAAPSVDSAQRTDASVLFAQEQNAKLEPAQQPSDSAIASQPGSAPASPSSVVAQVPSLGEAQQYPVAPPAASEGIAQPKNSPSENVQPLQTYQSDIAGVLQGGRVSVVSIAAAEADRRGTEPYANTSSPAGNESHPARTAIFILLGLIFLFAAGGVVWYTFFYNAPSSIQNPGLTPFIETDGVSVVTIPAGDHVAGVMQQLTSVKDAVSLSLGLVAQIYVQKASTSTNVQPAYVTTQEFLRLLAPTIPETLLRDLASVYVLGVHTFGVNQPFLILKVDSYEQAYAGMLAWESTMHADLSPLFAYTPAPKIQNQGSTPPVVPTPTTGFIATGFVDKIVNNHDARVLLNADGSVYFLWTFLDRSTIVVTTNADTLREVIIRLVDAPLSSLPGK